MTGVFDSGTLLAGGGVLNEAAFIETLPLNEDTVLHLIYSERLENAASSSGVEGIRNSPEAVAIKHTSSLRMNTANYRPLGGLGRRTVSGKQPPPGREGGSRPPRGGGGGYTPEIFGGRSSANLISLII